MTNGEVTSVTPVTDTTGSYDVAVASKSKSGLVAISTIASAAVAASTITVDVDTTVPQVTFSLTLCVCCSPCVLSSVLSPPLSCFSSSGAVESAASCVLPETHMCTCWD